MDCGTMPTPVEGTNQRTDQRRMQMERDVAGRFLVGSNDAKSNDDSMYLWIVVCLFGIAIIT